MEIQMYKSKGTKPLITAGFKYRSSLERRVVKLRREGRTQEAIAEKLIISQCLVSTILKKHADK